MQYLITGLAIGAVYALIAVGFAMVYSILNFSNFSHGVIMACGGFIGYFLVTSGCPWILSFVLTAVLCGILDIIVELLAFRRIRIKRGPLIYLFVASITVLSLIENILAKAFGKNIFGYPPLFEVTTVEIFGAVIPKTYILMFIVSIALLVLLNLFLQKTRVGIAIRAAATDLDTCSLMGIRVNLVISIAFFITGVVGGIAGMFLGINYTVYPQMGQLVVKGFMASVIGGLGSLNGAIIGAFMLGVIETVLTYFFGASLTPIGTFIILVAFLIFRPQGIAGISAEQKA